MRAAFRDIASGLFLLLLAIVLYLTARAIPARFPIGVDSGFLPEVVTTALGGLAAIIIYQGVRRSGKDRPEEDRNAPVSSRVGFTLALILGYCAGLSLVGFLPATLVFLTLQIYLLSPNAERSWKMAGAISVITTISVYALFTFAFGLVLPSTAIW